MPRPKRTSTTRWSVTATAMLLVLLVAAIIRLVALDELPPGLHFDEAVYGLLAQDIERGARPVFFSAYTGREPLYMYVMAALFGGIGVSSTAIRLTSAFIGIATVAITFTLGRTVYGRRVGVVAAGLIAVSYWHLTVSRNGYPNILIPPLEALSAVFLWRAWRADGRRWIDWALGGAFTGLVLYTYLAARFWPVFLVVFFLYAAVVARGDLKRNFGGVVVAALAAAAVFAPLGFHFLRNPHDFLERANQVLAWEQLEGGALLRAYAHNLRETFGGFLGRGDPRWHYNIPGRSVFQPVVGVFFLAGLIVCLRRIRDVRYGFPLLWIVVLVLPGVLTLEMQPAGQRIFGVFPALVIVPAIGLVAAAGYLTRLVDPRLASRWGRRRVDDGPMRLGATAGLGFAGTALIVFVLCVDLAVTVRDYFGDWVRQPETYHIFNADYTAAAPLIADDLAAGNTVVLLAEHYKHATLAFLVPESVDGAVWADPATALPIPVPRANGGMAVRAGARADEPAGDLVYYRLASYPQDDAPAVRWLEANALDVQRSPSGFDAELLAARDMPSLDVVRYVVPWDIAAWDVEPRTLGTEPPDGAPDTHVSGEIAYDRLRRREVAFGGEIAARIGGLDALTFGCPEGAGCRGVDTDGTLWWDRDRSPVVPVEWTVLARPPDGRGFAMHLLDENGLTRAQADVSGYLTEQWQPGDRVVQWFRLPIEPTIPPGRYEAHLIVVDEGGRPIAAQTEDGTAASAAVAVLGFDGGNERRAGGDVEPLALLENGLAVVWAHPLDVDASPGADVVARVLWAKLAPASDLLDEIAFLLVSDDDTVRFVGTAPIAGAYPPRFWVDREMLEGHYPVTLPADLPDGTYTLYVASAHTPAGERAVLTDDAFALGSVRVNVGDRLFEVPEMEHTIPSARFGSDVTLLGYDVDGEPLRSGEPITLTLYWRAEGAPSSDAKVFAHLLAADGRLLAQHDSAPAGGARPVSGWLPGEVVIDRHRIEVPSDLEAQAVSTGAAVGFSLGVGLYDGGTGERWPIDVDGDRPDDRRLILPLRFTRTIDE